MRLRLTAGDGRQARRLSAVIAAVLAVLLLSGCALSAPEQAQQLISKYNLQVFGPPIVRTAQLSNQNDNSNLIVASRASGLDLARHLGRVDLLGYPLNIGREDIAVAVFAVSDGNVVGAWVAHPGALGPVVPLADYATRR